MHIMSETKFGAMVYKPEWIQSEFGKCDQKISEYEHL